MAGGFRAGGTVPKKPGAAPSAPAPGSTNGPLGATWNGLNTVNTKESANAAGGAWYRDGNGNWVQASTTKRQMPAGVGARPVIGSSKSGPLPFGSSSARGQASSLSSLVSSLGLGGGSGGTVGAGTPGRVGAPPGIPAYTPPGQNASMTAQQNPYIKQLMELSLGQFDKPLDREKERSMLRREHSQRLNEAGQLASRSGGMWGSQQQQVTRGFAEQLAGQEAGFGDRETEARRSLLSTMSGIGGEGVRDIASQLSAQQAIAELQEKARSANMDYTIRLQQVADQGLNSRLSALSSLVELL